MATDPLLVVVQFCPFASHVVQLAKLPLTDALTAPPSTETLSSTAAPRADETGINSAERKMRMAKMDLLKAPFDNMDTPPKSNLYVHRKKKTLSPPNTVSTARRQGKRHNCRQPYQISDGLSIRRTTMGRWWTGAGADGNRSRTIDCGASVGRLIHICLNLVTPHLAPTPSPDHGECNVLLAGKEHSMLVRFAAGSSFNSRQRSSSCFRASAPAANR